MIEAKLPSALHVISGMDVKHGGPTLIVPSLGAATMETGRYQVRVLDFAKKGESSPYSKGESIQYNRLSRDLCQFVFSPTFRRRVRDLVRSSAVVHTHGLWKPHNSFLAVTALTKQIPVVVSAHGMLHQWALKTKGWKKYPYYHLAERHILSLCSCLLALTVAEVEDYRRMGLTTPVAVIPNGIEIQSLPSADLFLEAHGLARDQRLILFLGRIHPKKGVDVLCRAWSRIANSHPDAHLVIAGPGEKADIKRLEALIGTLSIKSRVSMTGLISGDVKLSALAASYCFVLPSHSEGLSVAVLEALAAGLPVVVSTACNQPEIEERRCGLISSATVDDVAVAVDHLLRLPSRDLIDMRIQARSLAETYSWSTIGTKMADVYDWVQGGKRPDGFIYQ